MRPSERTDPTDDIEQEIAETVRRAGHTVAVAESLTGGSLSAALSAIEGASEWFRGGLVAYAEQVKFALLHVDPGPVISASAARQMALGAAELLGSDIAVATTGVGGPGRQEGLPEGTVYVAVSTPTGCLVHEYHFDGGPADVVAGAKRQALADLNDAVRAV